jgi:hypothetical protein
MFLLFLENPVRDLPVEGAYSSGPNADQYLADPNLGNWKCHQG